MSQCCHKIMMFANCWLQFVQPHPRSFSLRLKWERPFYMGKASSKRSDTRGSAKKSEQENTTRRWWYGERASLFISRHSPSSKRLEQAGLQFLFFRPLSLPHWPLSVFPCFSLPHPLLCFPRFPAPSPLSERLEQAKKSPGDRLQQVLRTWEHDDHSSCR